MPFSSLLPPPMARRFAAAEGLACCKDGLGRWWRGGIFRPGRFNHAVKVSPELPDEDRPTINSTTIFTFSLLLLSGRINWYRPMPTFRL